MRQRAPTCACAPCAGILSAQQAAELLDCVQYDSYQRDVGHSEKLLESCKARVVATAAVSGKRFQTIAPGQGFVLVDAQPGHLQDSPVFSRPGTLKPPPLSTLGNTSPLMLRELLTSEHCGGFVGGNGPLQALDDFSAANGISQHGWEPGMLDLLCEGVPGHPLRMTDLAKSAKYQPTLLLGVDYAQTVFRSEQAGSLICAAYGQLDQTRYLWSSTTAAQLLGGKARSRPHAACTRASS